MALAKSPDGGSPPPFDLGARFSQKRVWFVWPPKRLGQYCRATNAALSGFD